MPRSNVVLKDVLEVTNRLEDKMGKRFDGLSRQIDGVKDSFVLKIEKTNKRIGVLELWKTEIVTRVSTIVAGVTLAVNIAWYFIKNKFSN